MKIEVLGPGCQKCTALAANVKAAADRLGIQYELSKVTKVTEFAKYGVMLTPALVVDGKVKLSGKAATEAELTSILTTALAEKEAGQ
ncbi:MAG: TM0996/MTH895 family glutaredoxin-like protein [Phycisphaerales bacterium]|nr:MAG: TM0996/MTH895 family glutaredoxin-like protein [Phycisphaerales bacterium]